MERFGEEGRVGSIPDLRLVKILSVVSQLLQLLSALAREDALVRNPSLVPPLSLLVLILLIFSKSINATGHTTFLR